MPLDLDEVQADIDRYGGTNRDQGDTLVAELRAAREAQAAAGALTRKLIVGWGDHGIPRDVLAGLYRIAELLNEEIPNV